MSECSICHEPIGPRGECGCGEPLEMRLASEGREETVRTVALANASATREGLLPVWTIYNRPTDHPEGFIARMHVAGAEGSQPTQDAFTGDLLEMREILWRAGLQRIDRHPSDEPQIVECWL